MSMFDYMKKPDTEDNPYGWSSEEKADAKPARSWPKVLRLVIEAALVLLVVVLIANGTGSGGSTSDPAASEPAEQLSEEPAPAKDPAFLGEQENDTVGEGGDTLEVEGLEVTAAALVDGTPSYNDSPTLCTTITMKNISTEVRDFGSYNWNLQTPSGFIDYHSTEGSDNFAPANGQIAAGGTVTGDICFPNKTTETGKFVVLYTPTYQLNYDEPATRGAWINNR
ncbi:hypothetical protein ACIQXM_02970 [Arthrobacter sp. NPDC097144]|uniref:hypothetical protein n=1 Tax=Arthrobacter sp. NPDC097144 TaxID=3363946 RepID=UPI003826642C